MKKMSFMAACVDFFGEENFPDTCGVPASPAWCPTHQHYKWCEHNGGVMGPNGWQAPAGVVLPSQAAAVVPRATGGRPRGAQRGT